MPLKNGEIMVVMKIFEKKSFVKIEKDDIDDAKLSSGDFSNSLTKKRAFVDVLGARLAMKLLFSKKIEAENIYSLYTIHSILEELDIADIYFQGIKMDVRLVFNQDEIFIPKSHFEYGLLPDMYIILQLKQDFSGAEFLGFFEPKNLDKKNQNKDFYFFEYEKLNSPETFKDFLDTFTAEDKSDVLEDSLDSSEKMFLYLVDKEISDKDKSFLMKQLATSISLREKMVEFENFELLSLAAANNKDLIQDGFMDIVGAQQIIEESEESALTHDEFAQEVGLPIKPKMGLDSLLSDTGNVNLSDSGDALADMTDEASKEEKKNDSGSGIAVGGALNAVAAGIGLGGAIIGAEAAQASTQAAAISGGADILSTGVESLGHGIGSVSANIAESVAKTSSSVSDSDFDLSELADDDSLEDLSFDEDSLDSLVDTSDSVSNEDLLNFDEVTNNDDLEVPQEAETEELMDLSGQSDENDSLSGVTEDLSDSDLNDDLFDLSAQSSTSENVEDLYETIDESNELFEINGKFEDLKDETPVVDEDFSDNSDELVDLQNLSEIDTPEVEEDLSQDELVDLNADTLGDTLGAFEELTPVDSSAFDNAEDELVGFEDLDSSAETIGSVGDLENLDSDFADVNLGDLPDLEVQPEVEEAVEQKSTYAYEPAAQEIQEEAETDENIGSQEIADETNILPGEITESDSSEEIIDLDSFDFDLLSDESENEAVSEDVSGENEFFGGDEQAPDDSDEFNQQIGQSEELIADVDDLFQDAEVSEEQDFEEDYENNQDWVTSDADGAVASDADKDLLKVLFQKEHVEEGSDFGPGYSKSLSSEEKKKIMVVAAVTSVVLASCLIGGIVVSHNHNAANLSQNLPSQALSGDPNQGQAPAGLDQNGMPNSGVGQPNSMPQDPSANTLQGNSDAQSQGMGQDTIGGTSTSQSDVNGVFTEPVNATISKIAWEVPEDLAYNDSFRRYLQIAGKNLKLNLQNDLLLANEMAYSDKVVVDLQISGNGSLQASNITTSSGSKQIDAIVLQSVKETIQYLKMPISEIGNRSIVATLIIRF